MDHVIVLAGGKGLRMQSQKPKALIDVVGKPMIRRVVDNIACICKKPTIIVGYKKDDIIAATKGAYTYVWQKEQLGTGHAVKCAKVFLKNNATIKNIIIIPGDHPLVSGETLEDLVRTHECEGDTITLATICVKDFEDERVQFYNCGRIVRDKNDSIKGIVERKDATEQQKMITEVNVSYYCFNATWLWHNIDKLKNDNSAQEYYLTDMITIAIQQNKKVTAYDLRKICEGVGVNTPEQLGLVEKYIKETSS